MSIPKKAIGWRKIPPADPLKTGVPRFIENRAVRATIYLCPEYPLIDRTEPTAV